VAQSPKQLENLRPWKPGESGNPGGGNGRPKGSVSLTKLIREALQRDELCGKKTPDGRPNAEWLVDRMIVLAMQGNATYAKEIIDRIDGKMTEKTDITSDGKPLTTHVERANNPRDITTTAAGDQPPAEAVGAD
jgi:hypothetical protein